MFLDFPSSPPVRLSLDSAGVDSMLAMVREGRAMMTPEHPRAFALGQTVQGVVGDPAWMTEPELLNRDSLLHVRDPGYGWLHYVIPSPEVQKLVELLSAQVAWKADDKPGPAN
jgi:hypothetical protein